MSGANGMPNVIRVIQVDSFSKLLSEIEKFQKKTNVSWYRGVRNSAYELSPSLYRHPKKKSAEELLSLEQKVTTRFGQRALPYLNRRLTDVWDSLFLMQHYGVPTRLLDWTENPLVSAYFALEDIKEHRTASAAIWMCDPIKWNKAAFKHISYDGAIFDETDPKISNHKPGTDVSGMPETPVMMFGSYNSPRIVAQRGVFSLFGKSTQPMNSYYEASYFPVDVLQKLEIPQDKVESLRDSLFRKGITETVVYPEIFGLAGELRREHGF
jgi:hypothetical protein